MKWKWVVKYKGYYKVSDTGKVKSVPRWTRYPHFGKITKSFHRGRILQDVPNREGYRQVGLTRNGKGKSFLIHQLVLEAFVGPRPRNKEARHKDSNPANNNPSNLRWSTHVRNCLDKVRRRTSIYGGKKNRHREERDRKKRLKFVATNIKEKASHAESPTQRRALKKREGQI